MIFFTRELVETRMAGLGNELADKFSELRRVMANEVLEEPRAERAEGTVHYLDVGNDCLDRSGYSMSREINGARTAAEAGDANVFYGLSGYIQDLCRRQADLERRPDALNLKGPTYTQASRGRHSHRQPRQQCGFC